MNSKTDVIPGSLGYLPATSSQRYPVPARGEKTMFASFICRQSKTSSRLAVPLAGQTGLRGIHMIRHLRPLHYHG